MNLQSLRSFFRANESPVYFIDWCLFTALGMEEWIANLQFLCATDTFDGTHPQIVTPQTLIYDHAHSSERTNNALLSNQELAAYVRSRGGGKALFWILNEETERLAANLGLEICLPPVALRHFWDHKANTNRMAEKAGVPCVPYVLSPVTDYAQFRQISRRLGEHLVAQMPYGSSGATTYFISDEADFDRYRAEITNGEEIKIMKRIDCISTGLEACVTRHGVVAAPLTAELIGFPELTVHQGGWCGNELYPDAFSPATIRQARDYTVLMGEQLRQVGYKGYFELDFLIDRNDGALYLGELNPRFSGISPLVNNASFSRKDIPLLLLHLAEWMDLDYELDTATLNERWTDQTLLEPLSFMHVNNVEEAPAQAIPTGIYRMEADGSVAFARPALNLETLTDDREAFWLGTSGKDSSIGKGEEMGGLFVRERVTDDNGQLTTKAKGWIEGIKACKHAAAAMLVSG